MKCGWVTYADKRCYELGALVLYKSLSVTQTLHDFVLMLPLGYKPVYGFPSGVRVIRVGDAVADAINLENMLYERYKATIQKTHTWCLEEYDKVCWIDSDMIVMRNIDHLFVEIELPDGGIAAAPGCTCNYYKKDKLPTRPDLCPFLHPSMSYINAGLFITRPNKDIFTKLIKEDYNRPFADQDAFNDFFEGKKLMLECTYNLMNQLPLVHKDACPKDFRDTHVFHFAYGKPWEGIKKQGTYQAFYEHWQSLAMEVSSLSRGDLKGSDGGACEDES